MQGRLLELGAARILAPAALCVVAHRLPVQEPLLEIPVRDQLGARGVQVDELTAGGRYRLTGTAFAGTIMDDASTNGLSGPSVAMGKHRMSKLVNRKPRHGGSRGNGRAAAKRAFADSLARAVDRVVRRLSPERIVLFGSHARGTANEDSDVDLLVIMDSMLPERERYLSVCRLLRPRPFPVDIIVKTPREISEALARGDFFLRDILAKGKVLYERHR